MLRCSCYITPIGYVTLSSLEPCGFERQTFDCYNVTRKKVKLGEARNRRAKNTPIYIFLLSIDYICNKLQSGSQPTAMRV